MVIPNSVTSIGEYAFEGWTGLTSVTIPNSVTSIGEEAFAYCDGLSSITIPNSVTSIDTSAFAGCTGLTSITIGNSATSIGYWAFSGCPELTDVTCMAESVPNTGIDVFGNSPINNATLYVPETAIDAYKTIYPWKYFKSIVGIATSAAQVRANAVLIQSESGSITVNGLDDGTNISVYSTNGVLCCSAISNNNSATIGTNLRPSSVAVVKIDEKSVKVVVK